MNGQSETTVSAAAALAAAESMIAEGADCWELLVSAGITWHANIDEGRWAIGDATLLLEKRYGDNALEKYAADIQMPTSRVRRYHTLCKFWHPKTSKREELRAAMPTLTYTHFLYAARLDDIETAAQFLLECHENGWTSDQANAEINRRKEKPVPPVKLIDTKLPIAEWGKRAVSFVLTPDQMLRLMDYYKDGRLVRLVIHEVAQAAEAGGAG